MQSKTKVRRKKIVQSALELKRTSDRYRRQGLVMGVVALAACLTPIVLYTVGMLDSNRLFIIAIPVIIMFAAGYAMNRRILEYRQAKKRFDDFCRKNKAVLSGE